MQLYGKPHRIELILAVVKATFAFARKKKIAIPSMLRLARRSRAVCIKWRRALERGDTNTARHRLNPHAPIAPVRNRMKVAIIDELCQFERNRRHRFKHRELN